MNKNKLSTDKQQMDYGNKNGFVIIIVVLVLVFILTSTLVVSKMFSNVMKTGAIQAHFTKAYFASESGLERALWEYSKNSFSFSSVSESNDVFNDTLSNGSSYSVDLATSSDAVYRYEKFISVGDYKNVKRSVEASFKILK